jgi:hypothetical protein
MSEDARQPYFDEGFEKQTRPFPKKWMDASRFRVGDRIEFIDDLLVWISETETRNLKGQIGIVEKVRPGYGPFPPRLHTDEAGQIWIGQHAGWLTVRFPFDIYGREADGRYKPRACNLDDEGHRWRKVAP